MPKRTRSGSVKRRVKRARKSRPRRMASRSMVYGNVHAFRRWGVFPDSSTSKANSTYSVLNGGGNWLIAAGANEADMAISFRLADVENSSEFSNLYDQYKIKAILVTIKMITNPDAQLTLNNSAANASTNFFPTLWYATDQDDANATSIAALRQFARVKHRVLMPNREIKIMLRPTVLNQLYGGLTSGYSLASPWVDMNRTDVQHYGLKLACDMEGLNTDTEAEGQYQLRINCKYYFQCKNAR